MIPKEIHQIWIGDKVKPTEWMQTWKVLNPDFKYKLWNDEMINRLLRKEPVWNLYKNYYGQKVFHGCADIARVFILRQFGGVYIDADSKCLVPIGTAPFMHSDFFAAYDHPTPGFPGRITNGVIGANSFDSIICEYAARLNRIDSEETEKPWKSIGGKMFTDCIRDYMEFWPESLNQETIKILPAWTFWPTNWDGKHIEPEETVYAEQMWGTSRGLYENIGNN